MRLFLTKPALWVAIGFLLGAAVPALAQAGLPLGELNCNEWHSTCEKPMFDLDAKRGAEGARDAQFEFSEYQQCLKRQADNDAQYAVQGIYGAAKKELMAAERDAAIWGFSIQ